MRPKDKVAVVKFAHSNANRVIQEMSMMRALGFLLSATIALVSHSAVAQNWLEYRPIGVGYAVDMPGRWTTQVQDIKTAAGLVKLHIATVDLGQRGYVSMYSQYPEAAVKATTPDAILDNGRNGAVANVKGKLRSEERFLLSNFSARQIIIDSPGDQVIVLRYFLMDNTIIQAIAAGPPSFENEPNTTRFVTSLKVVPR
jgi:hypothetical protein